MAEGWPRPAARSGRAERRENHSFTQQTPLITCFTGSRPTETSRPSPPAQRPQRGSAFTRSNEPTEGLPKAPIPTQ